MTVADGGSRGAIALAPRLDAADVGARLYAIETGASFLTGRELRTAPQQESARARISDALALVADRVPLRLGAPAARGSRRFYHVGDAQHGAPVLSPALFDIDESWLFEQLETCFTAGEWRLRDARLHVFDFGVATGVVRHTPSRKRALPFQEVAEVLLDLERQVGDALDRVARAVVDALEEAFADVELGVTPDARVIAARGKHLPAAGAVLWTWHHCRVVAGDADHAATAQEVARALCPNDFRLLEHRDHSYAAGVYASVTCSTPAAVADAHTLVECMVLQDAWWTLFWALDRTLLDLLIELEQQEATFAIAVARSRITRLRKMRERVRVLRSRMDSVLVSSGARDLAAWQLLARAWDLDLRIQVVETKLAHVEEAHEEAVRELTEARSFRIAVMIYLFTALSLVSVIVAVVQYAEGGVNDSALVRLTVLVVSVFSSVAAMTIGLRARRLRRS